MIFFVKLVKIKLIEIIEQTKITKGKKKKNISKHWPGATRYSQPQSHAHKNSKETSGQTEKYFRQQSNIQLKACSANGISFINV